MKELYDQIKSRYSLPDYDSLNRLFEISTLEDDEFLVRSVRGRILERLEKHIKIIDDLVHGDGSFASLHELSSVDEILRDKIFKVYSRFMFLSREALELSLKEDDDKSAEFINKVFQEWSELMDIMSSVVSALKSSWKDEIKLKEQLKYLG